MSNTRSVLDAYIANMGTLPVVTVNDNNFTLPCFHCKFVRNKVKVGSVVFDTCRRTHQHQGPDYLHNIFPPSSIWLLSTSHSAPLNAWTKVSFVSYEPTTRISSAKLLRCGSQGLNAASAGNYLRNTNPCTNPCTIPDSCCPTLAPKPYCHHVYSVCPLYV